MKKTFKELQIGEKFRSMKNSNIYVKIKHEKISCCKFYNAAEVNDANNKIGLKEDDVVFDITDEQ